MYAHADILIKIANTIIEREDKIRSLEFKLKDASPAMVDLLLREIRDLKGQLKGLKTFKRRHIDKTEAKQGSLF